MCNPLLALLPAAAAEQVTSGSFELCDGSSGGLGGVAGRIGGSLTRCANYGAVSGSNWYVGGVAEPKGAKALDTAAFASSAYLNELNVDRCFALTNGKYPEFGDAPGFTPCDGGENCPGAVFTDMPPKGNWAHDAIDWAVVNRITAGTSATTFSPDATCTRAQIVAFLYRDVTMK